MSGRKVRIGIDVGGTFTDAVAIDNETYKIIAKEKIPTTHSALEGVAKGIVDIINKILKVNNILPENVIFIAHGTTQATNALLEGDVAEVGIIGMGSGMEATKVKSDTNIGNIELSPGKYLKTSQKFIDSTLLNSLTIETAIDKLKSEGAAVIVASESFSVDDPSNELKVIEISNKRGLYATGGHEVSQLYGLKVRTRTAVINGSLIPKMMETANMTEECVKQSGITSELMIMRCDGGVMSVEEVRKRPILTMLSGLAAGVAGALMYEKVSDGIFFEVGGTSTDISVIKNGKVMIKYAEVGGHKTYLNSLDVRTLGIAGGSMIKVENGIITDVGPRSAHIAGMEYETFIAIENMKNPKLKLIAPKAEDKANYAVVECEDGNTFALTVAGAANILGTVPDNDYAKGDKKSSILAWEALAAQTNMSVEEAALKVMKIASAKVMKIVSALISEYNLTSNLVNLVGGGGSAGILVPFLGKEHGYKWSIAENAPYISTIGVALAMVREVVERTVLNPTNDDIAAIRREGFDRVVKSGANEATVEISIEIDRNANILRAIATGSTELRTRDLSQKVMSPEDLSIAAAESMCIADVKQVQLLAQVGKWYVFKGLKVEKKFLFKKRLTPFRVLDREGVVRLQKNFGDAYLASKEELLTDLSKFIDLHTEYTDAGGKLPAVYIYYGEKQLDLSGLNGKTQIISVAEMELEKLGNKENVIIVVVK